MSASDPARTLRLSGYEQHDPYFGGFGVEITAERLTASFSIGTSHGDGLAEFLFGLAQDFRGWQGTRSWRSLENDLTLAAGYESGGHVRLTWTARRFGWNWHEDIHWSVSVEFVREAGEEMLDLAREVSSFFGEPEVG